MNYGTCECNKLCFYRMKRVVLPSIFKVPCLNIDDQRHVFVLHYVFLPRINCVIESFCRGWNSHPIRTERNWSPEKIWTHGMLDKRKINILQVGELQNVLDGTIDDLEWFGVDLNAPSPNDDGLSTVVVENVQCPFDVESLNLLYSIDPCQESASFGIDVYCNATQLLSIS